MDFRLLVDSGLFLHLLKREEVIATLMGCGLSIFIIVIPALLFFNGTDQGNVKLLIIAPASRGFY